MTTRVEDDARKAADAERMQQRVDKEARDVKTSQTSREAFGKLVKTGQAQHQDAKGKAAKQGEAKQGEAQGQKVQKEAAANDRAARASRGGIQQQSKAMEQAKSFSGVLTNQQSSTAQTDKGRVEKRDAGKDKDRVERDDREVDVKRADTKKDVEADVARVEAREQGRPNAAIDADTSGGGDQRGRERAPMGMPQPTTVQAAQSTAASREVKQIPPELLEKLVSAVYLGVNEKGLKEFQIELKDGPFKGAFMRVSAEDGKVSLRFEGLDQNSKRLLEGCKGDLMKRLSAKGLSLARLDVK